MTAGYRVVIPARFESTRLPGKALLRIGSKPLIQHVFEAALKSRAQSIVVATDDERIGNVARDLGAEVLYSIGEHRSGTDRVAEAVTRLGYADDEVIVNLQGDEYDLPPGHVDRVAAALEEAPATPMATLATPVKSFEDYQDPNIVKVVTSGEGLALYFSRAPVPWGWDGQTSDVGSYQRHIGLYAYRCGFLRTYVTLQHCPLEQLERLEQLRALYHGYGIRVAEVGSCSSIGVDTEADLERARCAEEKN